MSTEKKPFAPSFTPEEKEAYAAAKQQERDELETKVKGLVESFRDSDTFKNYLTQMSDFNRRCGQYLHHYSPQNLLYIMIQDPTATICGSYRAWQKVGRHVAKGETGHIKVWAPIKEILKQPKLDENGQQILKPDGTPELEPVKDENGRTMRRFTGRFTLEPVYDVSQTEGEPLPQLMEELKSPVDHFEDYEKAIRKASPVPIYYSNQPEVSHIKLGEAKGAYAPSMKLIVVKEGMSEAQTLKTMVHETTHARLHNPKTIKTLKAQEGIDFDPKEIECQAECTAYVVCEHFGLDTSDYSIPYIASWAQDEKLTPFTNSLDVILKASDAIIDDMETELWLEMGIDEKLAEAQHEEKNRESDATEHAPTPGEPAIQEPAIESEPSPEPEPEPKPETEPEPTRPDDTDSQPEPASPTTAETLEARFAKNEAKLETMLENSPSAQKLVEAGYSTHIELVNVNDEQKPALVLSKAGDTVRVDITITDPDLTKPEQTSLEAYDLSLGGEPQKFFDGLFGGTLREQMADLRGNPHYANLIALHQAGFQLENDSGDNCRFTRVVNGHNVALDVPISSGENGRFPSFSVGEMRATIQFDGRETSIDHIRSVPRAIDQISQRLSAIDKQQSLNTQDPVEQLHAQRQRGESPEPKHEQAHARRNQDLDR